MCIVRVPTLDAVEPTLVEMFEDKVIKLPISFGHLRCITCNKNGMSKLIKI